jgi:hypothetical protein
LNRISVVSQFRVQALEPLAKVTIEKERHSVKPKSVE